MCSEHWQQWDYTHALDISTNYAELFKVYFVICDIYPYLITDLPKKSKTLEQCNNCLLRHRHFIYAVVFCTRIILQSIKFFGKKSFDFSNFLKKGKKIQINLVIQSMAKDEFTKVDFWWNSKCLKSRIQNVGKSNIAELNTSGCIQIRMTQAFRGKIVQIFQAKNAPWNLAWWCCYSGLTPNLVTEYFGQSSMCHIKKIY